MHLPTNTRVHLHAPEQFTYVCIKAHPSHATQQRRLPSPKQSLTHIHMLAPYTCIRPHTLVTRCCCCCRLLLLALLSSSHPHLQRVIQRRQCRQPRVLLPLLQFDLINRPHCQGWCCGGVGRSGGGWRKFTNGGQGGVSISMQECASALQHKQGEATELRSCRRKWKRRGVVQRYIKDRTQPRSCACKYCTAPRRV